MHGNAGGRIIGIIGIMGIMGIMRGWRHEIARGFACFCSETMQGCCAAVITQGYRFAAHLVVKRAGVVIKICDGIGGMHGNAGGRIIGIMGIMGIIGTMRGWRHEIARGFACLCSETVQGGCAAVKYHQQAGARGGSPKKRKLPADQSVGDSQGALPLSGAATSPRYLAFFAKLFFTWKKSGERRGGWQSRRKST